MAGTVLIAALAFHFAPLAALALAAKLTLELNTCRGASVSARLQRGPLRVLAITRFAFALPALTLFLFHRPALGFVCFLVGELLERTLFFKAVDSPKMPGVPSS